MKKKKDRTDILPLLRYRQYLPTCTDVICRQTIRATNKSESQQTATAPKTAVLQTTVAAGRHRKGVPYWLSCLSIGDSHQVHTGDASQNLGLGIPVLPVSRSTSQPIILPVTREVSPRTRQMGACR